jgi:hypothetical protein
MQDKIGRQRASRLRTQETKKRPHKRDVFVGMQKLPRTASNDLLNGAKSRIAFLYQLCPGMSTAGVRLGAADGLWRV